MRIDQRKNNQLREIKIEVSPMEFSNGSVILSTGKTKVLCSASIEEGVPKFLSGSNQGWLTAEYSMLPGSTNPRTNRNNNKKGRSQEIQRLIGRALRASIDFTKLGENTVVIDCDVLQADGGTRTASISGGFVALYLAVEKLKDNYNIQKTIIKNYIAAISVGIIDNKPFLDLNYEEDAKAQVDANFVICDNSKLSEIQVTGEEFLFSEDQYKDMYSLAKLGIDQIISKQKIVLDKN